MRRSIVFVLLALTSALGCGFDPSLPPGVSSDDDAIDGGLADGGTSTPNAFTVLPESLDFGAVVLGNSSGRAILSVIATSGEFAVPAPITSGPFAIENGCAGLVLTAGDICEIGVDFTPTAAGVVDGSVTIGQAAASLAGEGLLPGSLSFSPITHNFGTLDVNQESPAFNFTLMNTGGVSLSNVAASSTGANAYSIASSTCTDLPAGGSCTVGVKFKPGKGLSLAGTLIGRSGSEIATASLTGRGLATFFTLTVDVVASPTSRVVSSMGGIDCTGRLGQTDVCVTTLLKNDTVLLTASGDFKKWTGACSGTSPTCAVTMTASKTAGAEFLGPL